MKRVLLHLGTNFEQIFSILCLCTMIVLLSTIVFFRFALDRGLSFAEELERMAFVWFVYMGAAHAALRGRHIRVEAHLLLLNDRTRRVLRLLADGIWVWFNYIIVREGITVVHSMIIYPYESPALGWQMAYVYTIVPISFSLMSLRIIQHYVREFQEFRKSPRSMPQ